MTVTGAPPLERRFEELVRTNERRIYAIARSFAHPGERQDLCQEILMQLWKGLGSFQGRSAPSTWVYRVALNTAITHVRRNGRRSPLSADSFEASHLDPVWRSSGPSWYSHSPESEIPASAPTTP